MKEYSKCNNEIDKEYDIIDEVENTLEEIERKYLSSEQNIVRDKILYIKSLLKDLSCSLSGEYEELRRRRLIVI